MITSEAIEFLRVSAYKTHRIKWGMAGGGHGEGAPCPCIADCCSCIVTEGYSSWSINVNRGCNCGAITHNRLVDEAIEILAGLQTASQTPTVPLDGGA